MRNQMYPPPPPEGKRKGNNSLSPRLPLRGLIGALAACIILAACEAPTKPDNGGKTPNPTPTTPTPTAPTPKPLAAAVETTLSGKVTQQGRCGCR